MLFHFPVDYCHLNDQICLQVQLSTFSKNVAHQVFTLSPVWFDREEGLCWKSQRNILAAFLPQAADRDKNFRICPLGSSEVPLFQRLGVTSASGNVEKDGGESEQEWRCAHGRLQRGGWQQVRHKLVRWLFCLWHVDFKPSCFISTCA